MGECESLWHAAWPTPQALSRLRPPLGHPRSREDAEQAAVSLVAGVLRAYSKIGRSDRRVGMAAEKGRVKVSGSSTVYS